jgi:methionyl-tRNA formyltransferase
LETEKSVQLHDPAAHPHSASEYLLFSPGATRYDNQAGSLLIRCAEDTVLSVPRVKQESKGLIAAKDWWNGVKGLGLVDADQIQLVGKTDDQL